MALLDLAQAAADGADAGLGGFLLTAGWWLVPLILLGLVVFAVVGAQRRSRQRQRAAEAAGQLLLAETMRELRERAASTAPAPAPASEPAAGPGAPDAGTRETGTREAPPAASE